MKRSKSEDFTAQLPTMMEVLEGPLDEKQQLLNQLSVHRQRLEDISDILMAHSLNDRGVMYQEMRYYEEGILMLLQGLQCMSVSPFGHNADIFHQVSSLRDLALEMLDWIDQLKSRLSVL
jgi:hypothetical protein